MDIYSAEAQVKKLLEYVTTLSQSQSRMYNKTKVRLSELASTCSQVVEVISTILQDRALEECDQGPEFETQSDPDIRVALANMQSQLNALQQFVNSSPVSPTPVAPKVELSAATRKRVFADYKSALSKCASSASAYPAVIEISDLLWTWFKARFVSASNVNSSFQYNIRRWPEWIRDIVVMYGNAIETDTASTFVSDFQSWCNNLSYSEAKDRYAVPYSIYGFNKHKDPESLTLTSVILWDMLMDAGLSNISTDMQSSDLYLSSSAIYDLCEQLAPDVLDKYRHYKTDPAIDRRFRLLRADEVLK